MKKFLLLLFLLPSFCRAQLENLPGAFTLKTYPGNPVSLSFTVSGVSPMPTPITAVLRYGAGQRAYPSLNQPTVNVGTNSFVVNWPVYALTGQQYIDITLGNSVKITGWINSNYANPVSTSANAYTVNYTNAPPITLNLASSALNNAAVAALLAAKPDTSAVYTKQTINQLLAPKVSPVGRLRKVVVIGSSHAYGQGATNLMGWTKLLGQKLASSCQFIHLAVPGTDTPYWLGRIEADLKANRPDFVLIGLSLGNEWINIPDHNVAYKQFYSNMNLLAEFCRQNGAIPVIASTYPRGDFNAADYQLIKNMSRQLGDLGYFMIDILGVCDDGTGHYLPQFDSGDGLHVNDAGAAAHAAMVVPGIFRTSPAIMQPLRADKTTAGVRMPGVQTAAPINVAINSYQSITVGFEVRADAPNTDVKALALLVNSGNTRLRIRTPNNQIWLGDVNSGLVSSTAVVGTSWTHVAIRYNHATGVAALFINGIKQGEGNIGAGLSTTQVMLGGTETAANTATNHDFRNLTIHVAPLTDESIRDLSRGIITRGSLLNFSTLSEGNPVFLNQVFRNEDGLVVFPISGFSN